MQKEMERNDPRDNGDAMEWILPPAPALAYVSLVPEYKRFDFPPDAWSRARDRDREREQKMREAEWCEEQKRYNDIKSRIY
jgi:hypothetical protein